MSRYAIGIDYGTLSARAVVAEIGTGRELASAAMDYPHGVMNKALPDGTRLGQDWALEHPADYLEVLEKIVPDAVQKAGVDAREIIGLGVDFTACTLLPIDRDGTPLCFLRDWAGHPHAYAMLWKHHAAQREADRINQLAEERNESFLHRYGGKISSEWLLPKVWQILNEAPEVYKAADQFIEAGDFIVFCLTGRICRSASIAGYKAFWSREEGYPSREFLRALDPRLETLAEEKLRGDISVVGARAGGLTPAAAERLGLIPGTAVAAANIDAHVSFPPLGKLDSGDLLMIMGTSTCHVMVSEEKRSVPGISGIVEDGVIPGLIGYEANQMMGDQYNWFIENCIPENYEQQAREKGVGLHQLLREKAQQLKPGENGLIALDWWNGNRSVLVDGGLSGLIVGMTLQTKPEDLYRALIEGTAYGARMIHDTFEKSGVSIKNLYACGGIAQKDPFLMQIYADVTGHEIRVARSKQAPALGSAMFGAVAAGPENGGYRTIGEAAAEMGGVLETVYRPIPEHKALYDALFSEYRTLHDYFGRGENDVMKRLKRIREAWRAR